MKDNVDIPIMCAGRMDNPDMALEAVNNGTTDIISLGRPLLAEPEYVNKVRSGNFTDIRPCISCQEGCVGRMKEAFSINCAVNPQTGRERSTQLMKAITAKRVMIIGGGAAGCEAARVLALRGHRPEIYEKNSRLGGNLIPGGVPEFKEDDIALANWFAHTLDELKVPVYLNREMAEDDVIREAPDAVIIATGSSPKSFSIGKDENVYTADYVLTSKKNFGESFAIIGGGLVGCETALWLAMQGKKVTVIEMQEELLSINGPSCEANKDMLELLLPYHGVEIITSAEAKNYDDGKLSIDILGESRVINCETVVLAVGYKENSDLYRKLEFKIPELYLMGDANKVANIMYAIWDAFEVARHI